MGSADVKDKRGGRIEQGCVVSKGSQYDGIFRKGERSGEGKFLVQ